MGEGPVGAITHKRTVEAARKARSRRPARDKRMEVMTTIQPLRRPGHVSMEPGAFPGHGDCSERPLISRLGCPIPLSPAGLSNSLASTRSTIH